MVATRKETVGPRELYISSEPAVSITDLSRIFRGRVGCSFSNLNKRCKNEGWEALRKAHWERVTQEWRARQVESALEVMDRQLRDSRAMQGIGKGLLAAVQGALRALGGLERFLVPVDETGRVQGPIDRREVLAAARVGAELLDRGQAAERDLIGPVRPPETVPLMLLEVRYVRPEETGPETNGNEPSPTNGQD